VDEGIRLGVTVTPAFFIYGQLIMGTYLDLLNFPLKPLKILIN
jgi:uncharacterized membrane protein YdcZ (DUF606 family)